LVPGVEAAERARAAAALRVGAGVPAVREACGKPANRAPRRAAERVAGEPVQVALALPAEAETAAAALAEVVVLVVA
jgi:hypothetical protein